MKLLVPVILALSLGADLPPDYSAKFIKILLSTSSLPMEIDCLDGPLKEELLKLGIKTNEGAKICWATNPSQIKKGKLVICSSLELLKEGGAVAVILENGKPAVYLNKEVIGQSNVKLGDSIFKIGKSI